MSGVDVRCNRQKTKSVRIGRDRGVSSSLSSSSAIVSKRREKRGGSGDGGQVVCVLRIEG